MAELALSVPSKEERTTAAAVHIGAIFAPLWVPAIAYFVTRGKKQFVAAHARQSLVETIVLNVLIGAAMLGSFCYTVFRVWTLYQQGFENVDWGPVVWESLLRIGFWWLAMGVLWVINLIVSIRQALKAWGGVWPRADRRRAAKTAS